MEQQWREQCADAITLLIDWVNEQDFACFPIYLFGLSMGAATVLMTAGESLPDNVHGVIADSGYTSPRDEWKYVAENNMHCNYKLMEKYVDKLAMERIGYHTNWRKLLKGRLKVLL